MGTRRRLIGTALTGAVVTSGLAVAGTADAATVTESRSVYARDDAYTSSVRRTANFGAADKIVVGRTGGETRLSYVTFATGTLPSGAALTGAVVKLPLESAPATARLSLHPVIGSWSEGRITAANAPATSAAIATIVPKATDTVLKFDVSKWVRKAGTYSFALKSASTTAVTRIRAVEYGDAASGGPELALTYARTVSTPVTTTPTTAPTKAPTTTPTTTPTKAPTTTPTTAPTTVPTTAPTTTAPTTAPTTTVPTTTAPATTAPATTAPQQCTTDALLVPTCGVLWGAAAGGFTDTPRDQALKDWEALTGRTAAIFHQYHKGDEKFPTRAEIAMTRDPAKPRVLLLNWKVAYGTTWAAVARGEKNARIDNWAAYLKANYQDKFYLALHHEPENDVNPTAGSGMTAKDYAAMYRHVIQRLRANGITNAVNVLAYMGNEKWMAQSWWKDLYPGDDVVDWIGLDSYVSVEKGYYHFGDMYDLIHRKPSGGGTSWYDWAATVHPTKPVMVAEWGMYHRVAYPTDKTAAFNTVLPVLKAHPQIKAVVYFDTASDDEGDRNIAVNSTPGSLTAFRTIAADPMFNVTLTK